MVRSGAGSTRYSGGCRLGQQETQCSRRVWQPVLPVRPSILAWRTPVTEEPSRPQSTGSQRVGHDHMDRLKSFFDCGSSAPVRVECEGGTAAWLAGTLVVPSVQGHRLPPLQELWPYQSLLLRLL